MNDEEEITETHTEDFDRQTVTENEVVAKRRYTDLTSSRANGFKAREVRRWAAANNFEVAVKGRIKKHIVQAYKQANS